MGLFKDDDDGPPHEPFVRGDVVTTPRHGVSKVISCVTKNGLTRLLFTPEIDSPETGGRVIHLQAVG